MRQQRGSTDFLEGEKYSVSRPCGCRVATVTLPDATAPLAFGALPEAPCSENHFLCVSRSVCAVQRGTFMVATTCQTGSTAASVSKLRKKGLHRQTQFGNRERAALHGAGLTRRRRHRAGRRRRCGGAGPTRAEARRGRGGTPAVGVRRARATSAEHCYGTPSGVWAYTPTHSARARAPALFHSPSHCCETLVDPSGVRRGRARSLGLLCQ